MSVLKKIGQVILTAGGVASEVMGFPFVAQLLGKAAPAVTTGLSDLSSVAQIVSMMEVAFPSINGGKTGGQKLNAATPLVGQVVQSWAASNLPGHNKLKVDAATFTGHVQALTGAFADILNDFGE